MKVGVRDPNTGWDATDVARKERFSGANYDYFLFPGQEFRVYGLKFAEDEVWFLVLNPTGYLQPVPAVFFDVLDPRVSRHWLLQPHGAAAWLYPAELLDDPYFLDSMGDLEPEVMAQWRVVQSRLDEEFPDMT